MITIRIFTIRVNRQHMRLDNYMIVSNNPVDCMHELKVLVFDSYFLT